MVPLFHIIHVITIKLLKLIWQEETFDAVANATEKSSKKLSIGKK